MEGRKEGCWEGRRGAGKKGGVLGRKEGCCGWRALSCPCAILLHEKLLIITSVLRHCLLCKGFIFGAIKLKTQVCLVAVFIP